MKTEAVEFSACLVTLGILALLLAACEPRAVIVREPVLPSPAPVAPAPAPPQVSYPRASIRFVGVDADKVGTGFQPTPNGEPDGHFQVEVDTGREMMQVTGFVLYTSDARGNPVFSTQGWQTWSTTGPGWILGVERDGRRVNHTDRSVHDSVRGVAHYDLFANGPRWFGAGHYFTLVVRFGDGTNLQKTLRID